MIYTLSMTGVYEIDGSAVRPGQMVTDLTDIRGTGFFCDDEAASRIRQRIREIPADAVHRIDSGDCHYLSLFFLEKIETPFRLLLLDHHTDLQESVFGPGLLTCGSWAARSLENLPMCRGAVLLGPEEGGLPDQVPEGKEILWIRESELAAREAEWKQALAADGLPFYLSFDRDLLSPAVFQTDWSQGNLRADASMDLIRRACGEARMIGCDLCGEARPEAEPAVLSGNLRVTEQMLPVLAALVSTGLSDAAADRREAC